MSRATSARNSSPWLIPVHVILQQFGIVVAHLLEVRHHPPLIDRVPVKAARQLVVHTAAPCSRVEVIRLRKSSSPVRGGCPIHRALCDRVGVRYRQQRRSRAHTAQSANPAPRDAETSAPAQIPHVAESNYPKRRSPNRRNDRRRDPPVFSRKRLRLRDRVLHHLGLLDHIAILFLVRISNAQQHTPKVGRPSIARRITSSIKTASRPALRNAPNGHPPCPLTACTAADTGCQYPDARPDPPSPRRSAH